MRYRRRHTQISEELQVDWVVNCTGMERAGIGHSRLLETMRGDDVILLDPFGLGVEVDGQSRLLRTDGRSWPGLFATGALTAGSFWEDHGESDGEGPPFRGGKGRPNRDVSSTTPKRLAAANLLSE